VKFHVPIFSDELVPNENDVLPPCIINMTEYKFYISLSLSHTHTHTHTRARAHTHTCTHRKTCTKECCCGTFWAFLYLCLMMYEMHLKHLLHRAQGKHNLYGHSQRAARSEVQTLVVITAFLLSIPFQTGLGDQPTSSPLSTKALSPGVK
jgi:hypothetical protein